MTHILETETLAADDVLLIPSLGRLRSRSDAQLKPFMYSAPMDTVTGYDLTKRMVELGQHPVVCRNLPTSEWEKCLREFAGNPQVFFAISTCREWLKDLVDKLIELEVDQPINVAIDVAHGDMVMAHELAAYLKELGVCRYIMSGSICTLEAAKRAITAGCTHLRVGVGPGSVCTTRLQTGCGYPQLSAIYRISQGLEMEERKQVQIIADGGVRTPGDAAKYLSVGADAVMLGSRFSQAIEATGWEHDGWEPLDTSGPVSFPTPAPEPIFAKTFRGHASASFQRAHGKSSWCPEGASTKITWKGHTVESVVREFQGGISSAISYLGLTGITGLAPQNVRMIKITPGAVAEGKPHGV